MPSTHAETNPEKSMPLRNAGRSEGPIKHTDVIVIGGGGAGLAAASAAASAGRSVVLLEKNAELGGTTAWSVGSVSATRTSYQRARGIEDSPADHWEDLKLFSGIELARDNLDLNRVLCEETPEMFRWLESAGLEFIGPMPEPPHRRPRMHNVLPNSRAFPYHLGRLCRRQGVQIELNARVIELIFDGETARGVRARMADGSERVWHAKGGVVLAAGDFSANREMKERFASALAAASAPMNPSSTGDGIAMGLDAGGAIVNGDHLRGPVIRFVPPDRPALVTQLPPYRWLTRSMRWAFEHLPAVLLRPFMMRFLTTSLAPDATLFNEGVMLVDRNGRRIMERGGNRHHATAGAPGAISYLVFDSRIAKMFEAWPHFISTAPGIAYAYLDDYRRTRKDIFFTAPTIDALAARLGMPAAALHESTAKHGSGDREWSLEHPPYFALGPAKAYVVFTNGGLKVSAQTEVLQEDGTPIQGLFAAGSNGQGGMLLEGHGHHLGWAFVSGRIAGRNAAARC